MLQMPSLAKYKAFISYSRSDGGFVADLHRRLERYVLPAAMRHDADGEVRPRRPIRPVFRDKGELIPGGSLPDRLKLAVNESEFLIIVCSPAAAKRDWVNKEVRYFLEAHSLEKLVCIVASGEPGASHGARPDDECFPDALLEHSVRTGQEPLWLDARNQRRISQINLVRTVAALCELRSADELLRRDDARRKIQITSAAAAIVLFAAIFLGSLWLSNRTAALRQADDLERLAEAAADAGSHDRAGRFLLMSVSLRQKYLATPITPLGEALMRRTIAMPHLLFSFADHSPEVTTWSWSNDGNVLEFDTGEHVYRFDVLRDRLTQLPSKPDDTAESQDSLSLPFDKLSPDHAIYGGTDGHEVFFKDASTGAVQRLPIPADQGEFSSTGKYFVASSGHLDKGWNVWVIETRTRRIVLHGFLPLKDESPHAVGQPSSDAPWPHFSSDERAVSLCGISDCISWSVDGTRPPLTFHRNTDDATIPLVSPRGDMIAMEEGSSVRIVDFATGTELLKLAVGDIAGFEFSPDERKMVIGDRLGLISIWDIGRLPELAALPQTRVSQSYDVALNPAGAMLFGLLRDSGTVAAAPIGRGNRSLLIPTGKASSLFVTARPNLLGVMVGSQLRVGEWLADGRFVLLRSYAATDAQLTPRGDFFVITTGEGDEKQLSVVALGGRRVFNARNPDLTVLDVSPDGKRLFGKAGGIVMLVDTASGNAVWRKDLGKIQQARIFWPESIVAVLTADERDAVAKLFVFHADPGRAAQWSVVPTWRTQLAYLNFSEDGSMIAVSPPELTHFPSAPTEIWSTKDGSNLGIIAAQLGEANANGVLLPGSGNFVVAYNYDGTSIWDRATGIKIARLIAPPFQTVVLFAHGRLFAAGETGIATSQQLPAVLSEPASNLPAIICHSVLRASQRTITAQDVAFAPALRRQLGKGVCPS